jgi:hypothetical protein
MNQNGLQYEFTAIPWQHTGAGGWLFVAIPPDLAHEIRAHLKSEEEGWGRLKATAHIGKSTWATAIWFDTKWQTYLLPLKADVRKKEDLKVGHTYSITIWV